MSLHPLVSAVSVPKSGYVTHLDQIPHTVLEMIWFGSINHSELINVASST